MPEAKSIFPYVYTPEPPKKPPIIKVPCGIGDTDGFPAFDVDSDAYAAKEDPKWGFLITGGAEFHMPLTVFQVTPDGLADKGGIRLGDIILEINEEDVTQLTLAQAHQKIDESGKKIHFLVKNMDDDIDNLDGYEPGEEKSIVLRVPKPLPPPKASHATVTATNIEARLREMQRKLSEIAEIPKILSSTLATVSQTFDKLMPGDLQQQPQQRPALQKTRQQQQQQQRLRQLNNRNEWQSEQSMTSKQPRKHSYDEDALDYELNAAKSNTQRVKLKAKLKSKSKDKGKEQVKVNVNAKMMSSTMSASALKALVKDVTPESDYASEGNYEPNEADTDNENESDNENENDNNKHEQLDYKDYDDDDVVETNDDDVGDDFNDTADDSDDDDCNVDNDDDSDAQNDNDNENDNENDDENDDDDDDDDADADDDDFLNITYTWNLRKIPKLQLNDEENTNDNIQQQTEIHDQLNLTNDLDCDGIKPYKQRRRWWRRSSSRESDVINDALKSGQSTPTDDKQEKFTDKLERSWPWADREKIIYKQSTCHLVRRRPLGLVEQRIKLLAKQNLNDALEKQLH